MALLECPGRGMYYAGQFGRESRHETRTNRQST
jgi:hypothetical protein